MKRFIGIRNIVTSKTDWKYLLLYEIDGHEEHSCLQIIDQYSRMQTSFICYKSLNGFHFIGLSPMDSQLWGLYFKRLQNIVPEYFSGETIRLSLKENEEQKLIDFSFRYPYLDRLASIYFKRFKISKEVIPLYGESPKYSCVYEKYWTNKI